MEKTEAAEHVEQLRTMVRGLDELLNKLVREMSPETSQKAQDCIESASESLNSTRAHLRWAAYFLEGNQ